MKELIEVQQFYTNLIEWGGIYKVDKEHLVVDVEGKPVQLGTGNGETKELRVVHPKMRRMDVYTFNILVESMEKSIEWVWFREHIDETLAAITRTLMDRILEVATSESGKVPARLLPFTECVGKEVDAKMVGELEKIPDGKLLYYYYNKTERYGQLKTSLFDDEYMDSLKIRKKGIKVLRDLFAHLLQSRNPEKHFRHEAVELRMPRSECIINVMSLFSTVMAPTLDVFTGGKVPLFAPELEEACSKLSKLRAKCSCFSAGTVAQKKEISNEKVDKRPAYVPKARRGERSSRSVRGRVRDDEYDDEDDYELEPRGRGRVREVREERGSRGGRYRGREDREERGIVRISATSRKRGKPVRGTGRAPRRDYNLREGGP